MAVVGANCQTAKFNSPLNFPVIRYYETGYNIIDYIVQTSGSYLDVSCCGGDDQIRDFLDLNVTEVLQFHVLMQQLQYRMVVGGAALLQHVSQ